VTETESRLEPEVAFFVPGWPLAEAPNGIVSYVAALREGLDLCGVGSSVFVGRGGKTGEANVVPLSVRLSLGDRIERFVRTRLRVPDRLAPFAALLRKEVGARAPRGLRLFEMEESFGLVDRIRVPGVARVARLHGPWFVNGPALGVVEDAAFRERVSAEGRAISGADGVSAPSVDVLARVRDYYQLELPRAEVIPNPGPSVDRAATWRPDVARPKQVLFVGRFDRHKGGDLVVQAFARLASEDPEVELVFAGPDRGLTEGDSKISLDDYISRHVPSALRPRLHVLGSTDPVRIAKLRREAQLVIVPSRYENFPMAVVEACAYGCPMVGAATGGIAEIISHERNGLLFKMGDVDELTAAIRRLLDRPAEAAAFAEAARQDYELRFKPETLAARTLDFYRSIPRCGDIGQRPK